MRRCASLAALPLFVLVACGGGGTTSTPAATPLVTPGPASPLPAAACPEQPEPTGSPCVTVTIRDFAFDPAVVTVPMTARVVFVNEDGAAHSVAWADGTPTSPTLATGDSTERSFAGAPGGTLAYVCGIHGSSMSGQVVIDASLPVS